ncbi:uncharacterized protein LOC110052974 [Orbicella faveolata]|nr:uncharacterized protein LOC110052974 [Orbicella faveolata]
MPTAGEARLKSKSIKKTSGDGTSCKGKATRNKASASKIREVKKRTLSHPNSAKSSIPVPVKKEAKGKENADPNINVHPGTKINKKASKVKQAPDFRKLHRK